MPDYFSLDTPADRIEPGSLAGPIEVTADPGSTRPIGVAREVGQLGPWFDDVYIGPAEAVWELSIGGSSIPGRFLLRAGAFLALVVGKPE